MDWISENWMWLVAIIASILFGGLAGHVYSQYAVNRRNAKQKVLQIVRITSFFLKNDILGSEIAITENDRIYKFKNLFLVNIVVKNIGNAPYEKFDLGIDVGDDYEILKFEYSTENRKYELQFEGEKPEYGRPNNKVDLILSPLNRETEYYFDVQVHSKDKNSISEEDFTFSSTKDVELLKTVDKNIRNEDVEEGLKSYIPIIKVILWISIIGIVVNLITSELDQIIELLKK